MEVDCCGDGQYYLVPKHSERPETDESLLFVLDPCTFVKVKWTIFKLRTIINKN